MFLSCVWLWVSALVPQNRRKARARRGGCCAKTLARSDITAVEAMKGLQKTMEGILLVLWFYIKCYSALFHLLQVDNNTANNFTLVPGGNLVENWNQNRVRKCSVHLLLHSFKSCVDWLQHIFSCQTPKKAIMQVLITNESPVLFCFMKWKRFSTELPLRVQKSIHKMQAASALPLHDSKVVKYSTDNKHRF